MMSGVHLTIVRFFKNDICWRESPFNPKVNRPKVRKLDLNSLKSVLEPMSELPFRQTKNDTFFVLISKKYWILFLKDYL